MVKITTDHKWREFKDRSEVPAKVLREEFPRLPRSAKENFCYYRYRWYHVSQFQAIGRMEPELARWDGYLATGDWEGLLIRVSSNGQMYEIGKYEEE